MTARSVPATLHIWSGDFASQQLAFAHLLDCAEESGQVFDLDAVEVIPIAETRRRLAPYLGRDLPSFSGPVIILLATSPGSPAPFTHTRHLRYEGAFPGHALRAGAAWA